MLDLDALFDQHSAITASWSGSARACYQCFTERLSQDAPLTIKVGKGGLSYYKQTAHGRLFVCHFNAIPRRETSELGFADFRQDLLAPVLDVPRMIADLQAAVGSDLAIKPGKVWCSLHFPLARSADVADAFRVHLIAKLA
jgi:hypothetical protein